MKNSTFSSLIHQIHTKCQQAGWYGGWDFKPKERDIRFTTTPTSTFAFSPATEQQLQVTEKIIGFTLPPMLRSLFSELANGGFGPGGGLRGVVGGFGSVRSPRPNSERFINDETVGKFHGDGGQLVDVTAYQVQSEVRQIPRLHYDVWPKQLIPVCDLGCQVEVCLDQCGHLFYWGPSEDEGVYQFTDQGISLDQWLEIWLRLK